MNDDVLTKVDRATMSVSLEPLLDHRVPIDIKINKGNIYLDKYFTKRLWINQNQIPLNEWLRGELKPLVLKYLDNSRLDENIGEIERIKKRFFDIGTTILMWKEKWLD